MHILLPLLQELWTVLDLFVDKYMPDDFIACRDTVIFVMDEYAKKSEAIKRFNMHFFYEDKTRLSFAESLNRCNMVKLMIISNMSVLKNHYEFLGKLTNE